MTLSTDDLRTIDAAASLAHDYIWSTSSVTREEASDAIWTIHNLVRRDIPSPARTQDVSRETVPEWVRRAQSGALVSKDYTRSTL